MTQPSMQPPHEDLDCHRPLPRYVIRTRARGDIRDHFRVIFVGDLEGATKEAQLAADERTGFFAHRYQRVELWSEDGCHQRLATWHYGKLVDPLKVAS